MHRSGSSSIEKADWEAATQHIQRANGINPEMICSQFAEAVVAFTQAANSKDEAATIPFFKLFPFLGSKASEAGLAAYSDFVRTLISLPRPTGTGPNLNHPMIDKYYGLRSMVTVITQLNMELDRNANWILSNWEEDGQPQRERDYQLLISSTQSTSYYWYYDSQPSSKIDHIQPQCFYSNNFICNILNQLAYWTSKLIAIFCGKRSLHLSEGNVWYLKCSCCCY
ncbi:uncharacterized protein MELLADRAFT_96292 [Melampsora larici-populina 98AG31]|uniref:Conserved oligomeric Golgi complex subunit 4 N-terminal domain-containing protein n=1 Tax=Melampsora larici-populina (strain 98AG31 / pathotype 3-4-7) TaxID=747676 RepID=F4RE90_MELLP|nr:uncharacterized protein MELLADRAFT_96292 [Melampsora larici-populina 98AG31]EGG09313.1 hypothetical protein MELLADRAFT_96292 [Melampsora larici-populina 98AG31]